MHCYMLWSKQFQATNPSKTFNVMTLSRQTLVKAISTLECSLSCRCVAKINTQILFLKGHKRRGLQTGEDLSVVKTIVSLMCNRQQNVEEKWGKCYIFLSDFLFCLYFALPFFVHVKTFC